MEGLSISSARVRSEAIRGDESDRDGPARTSEDIRDISYRIVAPCKKYLNVGHSADGREGETVGRVVVLSERYVSA